MICTNCGNTVESFNKFCPKCGAPIQPQSPPLTGAGSPYTPPQTPMMGGPVQPAKKSSCGKIILIVGIILLLLLAGIAAAVYFGYRYAEKTLKSSEAYTVAVKALKESPEVKEQLGEIKETGFPLGAYTHNSDGTGDAAFTMSVQGTKGSGRYQVELKRRANVWHIENGFVRTDSGEVIRVGTKPLIDITEDEVNRNTNTAGPDNIDSSNTISGGVLNGKAISLPKPAYPPIARAAKASGTVVVQVLVDENGRVISARAVSGHPLLQGAAIAAARQARFSPTMRSGKPVKVSGVITYNFTLEQ